MPNNVYQSEYTGPQMDSKFSAVAALQEAVSALETAVAAKYTKPDGGIPSTDLDSDVQAALALALTAVQSLADYYTKAQVDAIAAAIAAAVNSTSGVTVTTLPSASADTLGKIYYVGPDGNGEYARKVTSYDGTTYSWLDLGTTAIDLTQYATKEELSQLDQKMDRIYPVFTVSEKCIFNGTDAMAELKTPIVLSQNGDSIEITVENMASTNGNGGGYAFGWGASTSKIGIAAGLKVYGVRVDDGTWIGQADNTGNQSASQTIKIEYKDGKIYYTANNGGWSKSYNSQKTLTIKGFGHTANSYGYWKGTISQVKVNGQVVYLSEIANLTNVTVQKYVTPLTPEQLVAIAPDLMLEKGEDFIFVYKKIAGTTFFRYSFGHYTEEYEAGDYPNNYDVWRLANIYLASWDGASFTTILRITAPSEFECAVNAMSAEDTPQYRYVGGSEHGFDKIKTGDYGREFCLLVDNLKVGETAVIPLRAIERFELRTSEEYFKAYSEDDKFAEVSKCWKVSTDNEMEVSMNIKFTAAIAVNQLQMGMFGCYRRIAGNTNNDYLTNSAIKDNKPFRVYDVSDGWYIADLINNDHACRRIVEYGEVGYGFALVALDDNRAANGGMMVRTNNGVYNKIYLDVTGEVSAVINDEYHATVRFECH